MRRVLNAKGNQLSSKVSRRIVWWSSRRWYSVIFVIPELTEDQPLWRRGDESLASIRLFDLTPDQLEKKVQHYWEKPRWRQWLLRLLVPMITQQIEAWSYYQQCLAFREIQKQSLPAEPCFVLATPADVLIDNLGRWLSEKEIRFHHTLEKRSVYRLKKYFESDLSRYEARRKKKFLKQLQKELKKLPSECNLLEVQQQAQAAYQDMEEAMRDYLFLWHSETYSSDDEKTAARAARKDQRMDVYRGASTESVISQSPPPALKPEEKGLCSATITECIKGKRQAIQALLSGEEYRDKDVYALLEGSFAMLTSFAEPQISVYQGVIREVILGRVGYELALPIIQRLQSALMALYRQGLLLFHPDHYQCGDSAEDVAPYWHDVFVRYRQHTERVMAQLDASHATLENYIAPILKRERTIAELNESYEKFALEWRAFAERMKERFKRWEEKLKEMDERSRIWCEDFKAEMEEKFKLQEERSKLREEQLKIEMEKFKAKIEHLTQLVQQLLAEQKNKEQTTANETSSMPQFFKPYV